jgi:hypothetical protein
VVPLAEIAPDALIPGRGSARELLSRIDAGSVTRMQPGE